MIKKHDHIKCKHSLKFCDHCDVVFCEKCSEEWKKSNMYWATATGGNTLTPWGSNITLCSADGSTPLSSHVHG